MKKDLKEILTTDILTELDVKLLLKRANNGTLTDEERKLFMAKSPYALSAEQVEKGRAWLMDQWKTPRGIERKNNPFGYREEDALSKFSTIELIDLYDAGNINYHYFMPVYRVRDVEDGGFDYYVKAGKIEIIG